MPLSGCKYIYMCVCVQSLVTSHCTDGIRVSTWFHVAISSHPSKTVEKSLPNQSLLGFAHVQSSWHSKCSTRASGMGVYPGIRLSGDRVKLRVKGPLEWQRNSDTWRLTTTTNQPTTTNQQQPTNNQPTTTNQQRSVVL